MMKWKRRMILSLLPVAGALVLEALPGGVTMQFASPPGQPAYDPLAFAYFDLTPYAYGNVFPFLAAILTAVAFILGAAALCKRAYTPKLQTAKCVFLILAFLLSLGADFAFGVPTVMGLVISAMLLLAGIAHLLVCRRPGI